MLCLQINPMTVYGMLHEHNIPKGEFLLQTAATSVLGKQMISLAKHYGVQTINIVRRQEAVQELNSIGYTFDRLFLYCGCGNACNHDSYT